MGFFDFLFKGEKAETVRNNYKNSSENRIYCTENLKSEDFIRFIFVKGTQLHSIESKLKEYGELQAKGNTHTYHFSRADMGEWTMIKIPEDFKDHCEYHNMIGWFLGYPPEDNNYADKAIGLSIKANKNESYLVYYDVHLNRKLKLEEDLLGVFENDEKFTLPIPFDELLINEHSQLKTYRDLLEDNNIDVELIKSGEIAFEEFAIFFNEK